MRPKVVVLTMFALEIEPWLDREGLTSTIAVPGLGEPLYGNAAGLCVATIGLGKVNAAAGVSALLNDPELDLSETYFITAGICGTSPTAGTLGFAAWADWIVDYDLGHHVSPATDPTIPHGYLKGLLTGTNVYRPNPALVREAYEITRSVPLADDAEAAENRAHYPSQVDRLPFVTTRATVTGDDFWSGKDASQTADYIVGQWTGGAGRYGTAQMEDNATAGVLDRYGHLDRYLSLRVASNFDQPYAGQPATEALNAFPGATIAVENAYRVGSAMAHHLVASRRYGGR